MDPVNRLRTWWQQQTGEEETPFDGDAPVWVVSMFFHLGLIFVLAFWPVYFGESLLGMTFESTPVEEEEELEIPEDFHFDDFRINDEIGAKSEDGSEMALAVAPEISDFSVVPSVTDLAPSEVGEIEINEVFETARGIQFDNLPVKGHVGEGTAGATGAVDRLTHEILLSLEERKTLVVWLFDQSPSMLKQRQEVHDRFDRIYEELGVIEAAGNEAFAQYEDKPLLTSIVSFGDRVSLVMKQPTDNLAEIKEGVKNINLDDTGTERVFSAIYMAANQFKGLRVPDKKTGEPERNVLLVVFTDEAGEDQNGLDQTVKMCRRYEMPVHVVGVPAPFGRKETMVKWIDPDPKFDQTPGWGRVDQGPESFLPERIKLSFEGTARDVRREERIDSGFGPFALTRLCYETGGIYFAVHPNRSVTKSVSRRDTAAYSSHLTQFFDPGVMRKYRPDYVSKDEYLRRLAGNKARTALVQAAKMSWLTPMESPQTSFRKQDEATFTNLLTDAQKQAAKLEPKLASLFEMLKLGEKDRGKEVSPRWQAGYDLAIGRVLATKVRTESYNQMLATAKRGLKPKNPKANMFELVPADEITTGSSMKKAANKAKEYLHRVVDDHAGTPWAYLAEKELERPLGWVWEDEYIAPPKPVARNPNPAANNNPAPAANDAARMMNRKPKRPVPKKL